MNNFAWRAIAGAHMVYLISNAIAFFYLPFSGQPWYVWIPLQTFLINLFFNAAFKDCPITRLENSFRVDAGYPTIRSFFGHYVIKNYFRLKRRFK